MIGSLELGIIYAVVALGVYLTFRVLNFPDLTVDGSFTTGGAVAAVLLFREVHPVIAVLAAFGAGMLAGAFTGLLHTKGRIDGLLAGILTMIALWSVNLRIMGLAQDPIREGAANLPLRSQETVFTVLRENGILGTWGSVLLLLAGVILLKLVIDWFLTTDLGLAIQATGNNKEMIRSLGVNTDNSTMLTLALSNGFVALCGALVAQYQGFSDISMGIGLILVGLASVILGQAVFGSRWVWLATFGVIFGAIAYRMIIFFALQVGLNPNDMKLITAVIVIAALLMPRLGIGKRLGLAGRRKGRDEEIGVTTASLVTVAAERGDADDPPVDATAGGATTTGKDAN